MSKERSQCRKAILKYGLVPEIVTVTRGGRTFKVWDGRTVINPALPPGRHGGASVGIPRQMRKMAREGYWGEIALSAAPRGREGLT